MITTSRFIAKAKRLRGINAMMKNKIRYTLTIFTVLHDQKLKNHHSKLRKVTN